MCCKPGEDAIGHCCASCITNIVWLSFLLRTDVLNGIVKRLRSVHWSSTLQTWYWFVIICVKCSHHGCVFEFIKIVWDGQCLHTLLHMGRCCEGLNSSGLPSFLKNNVLWSSLFYILLLWRSQSLCKFCEFILQRKWTDIYHKNSIMYSWFCHRVPKDPNLDPISA